MTRLPFFLAAVGVALIAIPIVSLIHCDATPQAPPAQSPVIPSEPPTPDPEQPRTPEADPTPRGELLQQTEHRTGRTYRFYLPADYRADRQFPLLLLGQDAGRDGAPLTTIDPHWLAAADGHGWLVLAVALNAPDGQGGLDLRAVRAVLADVLGRWSVDRSRMYLVGGQGAFEMAAALVADRPQRFAGLILLNPVLADGQAEPDRSKNLPPALAVFVEHAWATAESAGDRGVRPAVRAAAGQWLARLGYTNVQMTDVPDWPDATKPTFEFLAKQQRPE